MAEYRTIRITFWTDPYIEELEPEAKLLYIYLFTSPYTNNLGILESTRRKIAYETGIDISNVDKHLAFFAKTAKVVIDDAHNALLLTRFIKHQTSTSPKIIAGLKKLVPTIPSKLLANTLFALYPTVFDGCEYRSDTISIPYRDTTDTLSVPYQNDTDTISIPSAEREEEEEREEEVLSVSNETDGVSVATETSSPLPQCPQRKILALYHAELNTLPVMKVWEGTREKMLASRWRERSAAGKYLTEKEGLAYWKNLFSYIRDNCPFLMGQVAPHDSNRPPFRASLDWIVRPQNFAKIIEGKYERGMQA